MKPNQLKFKKEEVYIYYQYFKDNHTIKETANYFNISYRDILHYFIYYGYYQPKKKYNNVSNLCTNPDFFSEIDSPIKAYFLGLLMSDGYILTSLYNKEVGLALKTEDKYILDILNNYISPSKKVSKYKNSYKWKVISPKMYEDLQKYGITENKSYKEYHYPDIPSEFDKDFIRGYFDGDGCISIKSTGYSVISFASNSKVFLQDLANKLLQYNIKTRPIFSSKRRTGNILHTLYISGGANKSVFKKFLYDKASLFLYRKYEKFKEIPC